jgi:biopolymer transport protein ExbB
MHVSARYANSRLRILVLAALLIAAFITLRTSLGQPAPPAPAPSAPVSPAPAGGAAAPAPVLPAPSTPAATETPAPALPAPAVPSAAAAPGTAAPAADSTSNAAGNVDLFYIMMQNRDPIFYTIILLSVIGVALIIQGFIKTRAGVLMPRMATDHMRDLITRRRFQELLDYTTSEPSFVARSLAPALRRAPDFDRMKEAMETAIGEQTAEQFRRIEYLNIIGNLGPLLGLLGTVLGMIDAFAEVQNHAGQASVPDLAGGISKALCHTFLGLMLAVPCLAAFGVLRTLVDRLTIAASLLAEELLLMLKPAADATPRPGINRPAPAPAPAPSAPTANASAVS